MQPSREADDDEDYEDELELDDEDESWVKIWALWDKWEIFLFLDSLLIFSLALWTVCKNVNHL